jgi:type I pantothenate kinase
LAQAWNGDERQVRAEDLDLATARILALRAARPDRPVLVGLDGPVAAGKSTAAARIAADLQVHGLGVAVVSADGFLLEATRLRDAGLMARKGFPESFDRDAIRAFLAAVREGEAPDAPRYSHADYDVSSQDPQSGAGAVVIFEGVNVLAADLATLYDLRLYLDVPEAIAKARFLKRFVATPFTPLRRAALAPWKPADEDPSAWGEAVWAAINGPNLRDHILAGRAGADLVLGG